HPCVEKGLPGVYEASGSLGQGLSVAAGAAIGKKLNNENNYVFVLMGDGESEEGQNWEAAMFAAHNKINNLIAITDWNGQQIDGTTDSVMGVGDLEAKWKAFGWNVIVADGHNMEDILNSFKQAKLMEGKEEKPVMILMKTSMGKGVDFMEGTCEWHGKAPKPEVAQKALAQLAETLGDF
ncbi:MAG: thiamine pyrophosphate-dependent enzyme, partial [Bacteroidales bacterium]